MLQFCNRCVMSTTTFYNIQIASDMQYNRSFLNLIDSSHFQIKKRKRLEILYTYLLDPPPPTDTTKSYSLITYCIYNCIYNSIFNYHNEYSMEYSNLLTENVLRLSSYRLFHSNCIFNNTLFPDNHLQKGSAQCILLYHNPLPNTLDYSL